MEASNEKHEIPKKWTSIVKIKPLAENDIININDKEKDKYYKGAEGNTIEMKYARGVEKYKFDKVIHPEED
jgi:hypothetical protein